MAHAPVFIAQPGGLPGLLDAVCPVRLLHRLHFAAQTAGRALVAKGQIQRPAQQRQQPDEGDPAHLIGAVFVLAHQIQNDQQAQPVECSCDPHPRRTGGEGEKHPRQPCKLQCHQHHRDRDAVEDAVEKFDDRQSEQHTISPFRVKVYLKTKKMTNISQAQAGFKANSRRNPLWISRLFNAKASCVCRNRLNFRLFRYTLAYLYNTVKYNAVFPPLQVFGVGCTGIIPRKKNSPERPQMPR